MCPPRRILIPLARTPAVVRGFRRGTDRLRIIVADADTEISATIHDEGVALRLRSAGTDRTVFFPGLDVLPVDDVQLQVKDDAATRVLLRDLFDLAKTAPRQRPTTQFVVRPGQPLPVFPAFSPGRQLIEIFVDLPTGHDPDVTVQPDATGRDGVVLVDGRPTAILAGAPEATHRDLRIISQWNGTHPMD